MNDYTWSTEISVCDIGIGWAAWDILKSIELQLESFTCTQYTYIDWMLFEEAELRLHYPLG